MAESPGSDAGKSATVEEASSSSGELTLSAESSELPLFSACVSWGSEGSGVGS